MLTEAAIVRHHIHEQWAQSVAARVAAGRAIDQVAIAQARQDGALILTCPRNDSRFREGDVLCLNRGDPFEPPHLIVTLEEDDDTRLQVLVENFGVNWGELARQPTDWVLDEGFLDLSRYVLDALDEAADTAAGRDRILPLLTEETAPALSVARYEAALAYAAAQGREIRSRLRTVSRLVITTSGPVPELLVRVLALTEQQTGTSRAGQAAG